MFSPFARTLEFEKLNPLDDGLGYEIERERSDPDTVSFQDDLDADNLTAFWSKVEQDIHGE